MVVDEERNNKVYEQMNLGFVDGLKARQQTDLQIICLLFGLLSF